METKSASLSTQKELEKLAVYQDILQLLPIFKLWNVWAGRVAAIFEKVSQNFKARKKQELKAKKFIRKVNEFF